MAKVLVNMQLPGTDGNSHHLHVYSPHGAGGGSFFVYIDNYFVGAIVKYITGWSAQVESPHLYSADLGVLEELAAHSESQV
jgi:hypothetical protein